MSRYQQQSEKLEAEKVKKAQNIEIIQTVAGEFNSSRNLNDILQIVLDTLERMLDFRHSMILLINETGEMLSVVASHGFGSEGIGANVPIGVGVIGTVAKHKKLLRMNNIQYQRQYAQSVKQQLQKSGGYSSVLNSEVQLPGLDNAQSQLAIPLLIKDCLIGVFSVEDPAINAFNSLDEALLTIIASQAAGAIENARLSEIDAKRVHTLNKAFEELAELNRNLEGKVRERTLQFEEAKRSAEIANHAKSEFLASMSHELRTPLNAVLGFSQVLQEKYFGELTPKQEEYVNNILESGQHLLSLINDILDLSKIEAGKMGLDLSRVKIKQVLNSSILMIKEKALAHGIKLDVDTTADIEDMVITIDERKIKQVMFNLLSNAAKFTPDGGAICISSRKNEQELVVSVTDTGLGIHPDEQKKIFEEFYQSASGSNNKTPGTGLGLPLAKNMIKMHGGRMWVESEGLGKGSRFIFTLPLSNPENILSTGK